MTSESDFTERLSKDPGDSIFVDYAVKLAGSDRHLEALEVCLRGLSANPGCHSGRLMLAKEFYSLGFTPFAIREVRDLCAKIPESESLRRLLNKLSGGAVSAIGSENDAKGNETTVAEADFDMDDIEELEKDSKKNPN